MKNPKLILAHFAPDELRTMEHLQGGGSVHKMTGLPVFQKLWDFASNPHVRGAMEQSHREGKARGGQITGGLSKALGKIANEGRRGDSKLAMIPTGMADYLDSLMGQESINPHTGLKEYWGLSDAWNGIKNVGSHIGSGISSAARAAGDATRTVGNGLWNGAKSAGNWIYENGHEALPFLTAAGMGAANYYGGNKDLAGSIGAATGAMAGANAAQGATKSLGGSGPGSQWIAGLGGGAAGGYGGKKLGEYAGNAPGRALDYAKNKASQAAQYVGNGAKAVASAGSQALNPLVPRAFQPQVSVPKPSYADLGASANSNGHVISRNGINLGSNNVLDDTYKSPGQISQNARTAAALQAREHKAWESQFDNDEFYDA